jgi:hypothetical protein
MVLPGHDDNTAPGVASMWWMADVDIMICLTEVPKMRINYSQEMCKSFSRNCQLTYPHGAGVEDPRGCGGLP